MSVNNGDRVEASVVNAAFVSKSSTSEQLMAGAFRPAALTTAQRDALSSPSDGTLIYNTTTKKLNQYSTDTSTWEELSGSGSGSKNYITNPTADTTTDGWVVYRDGSTDAPIDGTGGTPVSGITINRNSVNPVLSGDANFLLQATSSNEQGEGISYDFEVDYSDRSSVLEISFDYFRAVGTNDDLVIYIYDVENSQLIQPTPYKLDGSGKFKSYFQAAAWNGAAATHTYRLIFHFTDNVSPSWQLEFDNVFVGPAERIVGSKVLECRVSGDPASATSTKIIFPTVDRDSASIYSNGVFTAPESGLYALSGMLTGPTANIEMYAYIDGVQDNLIGKTEASGETTISGVVKMDAGQQLEIRPNGTVDFTGNNVSFFKISDSLAITDNRIVASSQFLATADAISSSGNIVIFDSSGGDEFDTFGAYDSTTGIYSIPQPGKYKISSRILTAAHSMAANNNVYLSIRKNSTAVVTGFDISETNAARAFAPSVEGTIDCVAGDTIDIFAGTSSGNTSHNGVAAYNNFTIEKIQGPAQIGPNETVACKYYSDGSNASGSFVNNTDNPIDYNVKEFDTHNMVTVGASWVAQVPTAGFYRINAGFQLQTDTGYNENESIQMKLYIDGSPYETMGLSVSQVTTGTGITFNCNGTTLVKLTAGQTIQINGYHNNGSGGILLEGTADINTVIIQRVGI